MISVVCVYNDEKILNDFLLKSLKDQTVEYQLIKIDNTRNTFQSAAEALNYGGNKARGNYIMFVHQDVDLCSNLWLEEVEKMLDNLQNLGIAGVAGKSEHKKHTITNIKHGNPPRLASKIQITSPEKVQTLDGCLVIIPRSVFDKLGFDEEACADWHLYDVDYCLSARRLGFDAYAIPMFIYHRSGGAPTGLFHVILSSGPYPRGYYQTLGKILKKHKNQVKKIYATTETWSTSQPLVWQRMVKLTMYLLVKLGFGYLYRKSGLKYLWKKLKKVV
ncbi:MAG: ATP synthase subunits region ORF 6 [candidate division WS2 bacterium]|nr:ATP synthase subunits region ORF 6 [Candidatus Psychracetigena formicireducens]